MAAASEHSSPLQAELKPVRRISIGRRLTVCSVLIILVMAAGSALLLWQTHLVRQEADHLNGVDQELIAVLRFQTSLRSFDKRLNDIAESKNAARVFEESETLRAELIEDARHTQATFNRLPPEVKPDPTLTATLRAIQSSLPAHVEAMRTLAVSGDWTALRARLDNQFEPLEYLSAELVQGVDREVVAERALASVSIAQAERRMSLIVLMTGLITLLTAAVLGAFLTRSITAPLKRLMEGSRALARGEFHHQIPIVGQDELAQLGSVFNDTAQKLRDLYDELRRSETHLADAQSLSHTASWVWDVHQGKPVYWSAEMFRIHNLQPDGTPPAPEIIRSLYASGDRDRFEEAMRRAIQDKVDIDYGSHLSFPDGSLKFVRIVGHPVLNQDGLVVEVMGTTLDVTDQHQSEEALRKTQERLARAKQIATVGELAAAIAHEVNQPLSAVITNGHACQSWLSNDPPNLERARQSAEKIIRNGNSAADVVQRIRALFKQAAPAKMQVDVNLIIVDVLRLLADGIRKKSVRVETHLQPGLPATLGDRVQLQQVVLNLVLNGIESMDEVMDRPRVLVVRSLRHGAASLMVEVQDQGVGLVDPERVFDALFTTKENGMGMGLAICRSIIDAHRGTLWAQPGNGAGTSFFFTLPMEAAD